MPVFVVDPAFDRAGAPRRAYLHDCLTALDQLDPRRRRRGLVIRVGDPVDRDPEAGRRSSTSPTVFVSRDYGPYGRARDAAVGRRLAAAGRHLRGVGSPYAVAPGDVRKDDGTPYAVFTPFSKVVAPGRLGRIRSTSGGSRRSAGRRRPIASDPLFERPDPGCELPPVGERRGDATAGTSSARPTGSTATTSERDLPALDGTSRLSPALRWGTDPSATTPRRPRRLRRRRAGAHRVLQRTGLARLLRRRAVPTARVGVAEPEPQDGSDAGRHRRGGAASDSSDGVPDDRFRDRRRRDAPTGGDGLDAQPGAHDRRQLPGQGPAPPVAVGRSLVHAAPRRRRPRVEQPRVAVGGRDGYRRRAVLPGVQPDDPTGALRPRPASTSTRWVPEPVPPMLDHAAERNEALARLKSLPR